MNFLNSISKKHLHIILQLGPTNNGIVATHHFRPVQHIRIGQQLHSGNQFSALLIVWSKTPGPRRRIFCHSLPVRNAFSHRISHRHPRPAIRNTANGIYLSIIAFSNQRPIPEPYFLYLYSFISRGGEPILYPQERANLQLFPGSQNLVNLRNTAPGIFPLRANKFIRVNKVYQGQ